LQRKIILIPLFFISTVFSGQVNPKHIFSQNKKLVGEIVTDHGYGTGFLFGHDDAIITAKHLVDGVSRISVILEGEKYNVDQVYYFENSIDIAILKLDRDTKPIKVKYRISNAGALDPVLLIANPYGLARTVTTGYISNIINKNGNIYYIATAASSLGSSGGPVFNYNGALVGVHTGNYGGVHQSIISMDTIIGNIDEISLMPTYKYFGRTRRIFGSLKNAIYKPVNYLNTVLNK